MYRYVLTISIALISLSTIGQINIQKDGIISDYKTIGQTKSIAGAEYYVATQNNPKGETYSMAAVPSSGDHTRNISESEFEKVKTAFEKEFDIELVYHANKKNKKTKAIWLAQKDNVSFQIIVNKYNPTDYYPYAIQLSITNLN